MISGNEKPRLQFTLYFFLLPFFKRSKITSLKQAKNNCVANVIIEVDVKLILAEKKQMFKVELKTTQIYSAV